MAPAVANRVSELLWSATLDCGDASPLSHFHCGAGVFRDPALTSRGEKAATPRIENLKATMHRRTPEVALSD
jgi:hypothetical protein